MVRLPSQDLNQHTGTYSCPRPSRNYLRESSGQSEFPTWKSPPQMLCCKGDWEYSPSPAFSSVPCLKPVQLCRWLDWGVPAPPRGWTSEVPWVSAQALPWCPAEPQLQDKPDCNSYNLNSVALATQSIITLEQRVPDLEWASVGNVILSVIIFIVPPKK